MKEQHELLDVDKLIKEYSERESEYIEKFRAIENLCKLFPICRQFLNGQLYVALIRNETTDILMGKLKIDTSLEKNSTMIMYLKVINQDVKLYLQTENINGINVKRIDTTNELQFAIKSFLKEELKYTKQAKFLFFGDNTTEDEEGFNLNFNITEQPVSVERLETIAYNGF